MVEPTHRQESSAPVAKSAQRRPGSALFRWLPLVAVAVGLGLGYAFGLHRYFSLAALREYDAGLTALVAEGPLRAAAAFVLLYVVAVALSFPGASFLTIAGGFLFGAAAGTALAWTGATIGATAIFLAARTSLGRLLADRAGSRLQRLRAGFQAEGFSYLMFLRLVPVFPFWLINLAAGLFGMRLATYVAATAIGILPGTFVFAYFGYSLGTVLQSGGSPLSIELFVGLALLGVLALVPALVRRWRRGREPGRGAQI